MDNRNVLNLENMRKGLRLSVIHKVLILFVPFLIGFGHIYPQVPEYEFRSVSGEKETIKIGVGNLKFRNLNSSGLSRAIVDEGCDVFVGLEWTSKNLDRNSLKKAGYRFFLDYPKTGTHGICIIGKKGIKGNACIQQAPVKGPCAIPYGVLRIKTDEMNVSILGIHVPPPAASCKKTTDTTIVEFSELVKDGMLLKDIGVAGKNDIVIIGGDFNVLPGNKSLKKIRKSGLVDSYRKMNLLPGPTWSAKRWLPPCFRIDYVFVSKALEIKRSKRFRLPGSDHRAVVTVVVLKK